MFILSAPFIFDFLFITDLPIDGGKLRPNSLNELFPQRPKNKICFNESFASLDEEGNRKKPARSFEQRLEDCPKEEKENALKKKYCVNFSLNGRIEPDSHFLEFCKRNNIKF
jgi:hypothetical protein